LILWINQEEFLADLVNFLESRGHGRLIPPAGVDAFPEVVLNGKRLDLYNLYREVLCSGTRGKYQVLVFVSGLFGTVIIYNGMFLSRIHVCYGK
jgi:hypothetical protein